MKPYTTESGQPKELSHLPYRADIDGLRAIAVLLVVGFHLFPDGIVGGFIGVDIFFVISGFLISSIIFQSLENESFSFTRFYSRRIKRIFPSLLTVLIFCAIFGWLFLLADEYKQLGKHIFSGSVFVSNFTLLNESGYFDNAADTKPLLHLWSLGIEEQFYIFWPFIVYASRRIGFTLTTTILTIIGISFGLSIWQTDNSAIAAFYSPQTRFWELSIGSFLASYLASDNKLKRDSNSKNIFSGCGLILISASVFLITKESLFPGWRALLPSFGAALIILGGATSWINHKILSNRVLIWFGLISFPLYLWHWPLLSFARIIEGDIPSEGIRILAAAIAVALAWLTYIIIEKPIRFKLKNKWTTPILFSLLIFIGLAGLSIDINNGYESREQLKNSVNQKVTSQFVGALWKYTKNQSCLERYPFEEAKDYGWWFCMKSMNVEPTVMLLGTSYANQLYPGFTLNPELKHHSILSIGACDASGYQPSDLDIKGSNPCVSDRVKHQRKFINDIIKSSPSIKYVVMDGLSQTPDIQYIENLSRRIDLIESFGKVVIIFTPHLKPDFHPKACYSRPSVKPKKDCYFTSDVKEKQQKNFQPLVDLISKSNPKVLFFDQNDLFCDGKKCSYIKDGIPLHRDPSHLSEYGSIKLSELFVNWAYINIPSMLNPK